MKKIETPLTWALIIISLILITLTSLNSSKESTNYGPWGEESCDSNNGKIDGDLISSDTILSEQFFAKPIDSLKNGKIIKDTVLLE